MTEKLLSCPFCGGEASVMQYREPVVNGWVGCPECRCFIDWVKAGKSLAITAWNRRAQPENKPCADCSGIIYRQTNSGKIVPADQRCAEKITPPCYQPDGDGCAYQTNGDGNEPIEKCQECPLCYSDKSRHINNKPLTLEELREMDGEPVYIDDWFQDFHGWELSADALDYFDDRDTAQYGSQWLAYRSKPKEEV